MDMLKSATKMVLVILVVTLCVGTIVTKTIDPKDFINAVLMVLAFYFGGKSNNTPSNASQSID